MSDTAYIPRLIDLALDSLLEELPAIMLTGPRGCGKTTTALRRAVSALRLDQPDQAAAFRASPDAILSAQKTPVLLDEWQNVPESLGAVKRAVDARSGAGRFLVTGSVRSRLSSAGWPATGRIVPLSMSGLTEGELEASPSAATALNRLFATQDPVTGMLTDAPDLVEYVSRIVRGGFPGAIRLGALARAAWYEGYVEQLVRHDVTEMAAVRSPAALAALVRAVALNTAGRPSLAALTQATGADQRTVKAYLDLLEAVRIVERLPAWGVNRFNRMVKSPKYHIMDPGMAVHLAGDDQAGLLASADRLGRLLDTFVMAQIRPLLRLGMPVVNAFHLRDANGEREIDLVLESASGLIVGIEIKAASAIPARTARHLAWLRDQLGPSFVRGVVLHTGSMTFPLGEKLWAMPIARLWRG